MITVQVQLERHGDLYPFLAPESAGHGDEVIVRIGGTEARGFIVALGAPSAATQEIVRLVGQGEGDGDDDET